MRAVMEQLIDGGTIVHRLTIPEGLTVGGDRGAGGGGAATSTGDAAAGVPAEARCCRRPISSRGATPARSCVERMRRAMSDALAELWPARDGTVPLKTPRRR